jgi:transposase
LTEIETISMEEIVMKKTKVKEEVLKMRFEEVYDRFQKKRLTTEEASELLGISVSTFYRKRERYEEEGFEGIYDKRFLKQSPHKVPDREVEWITQLYVRKYRGFSVKHFHEFACRHHGLNYSYTWTKNQLTRAGLVKVSKRGGDHRLRRERRPMTGMMLHQDGSTHEWIPGLGHKVDLIVTMDDATSLVTSAFFVLQEGTESSFRGIQETIEKYGLFCSLYTDRGSHYWTTPEAGGKVDKQNLTQVGRALRQLGIQHIAAYSPQARGRSERLFGTLQNRLPKELALHGITTLEEANTYLKEVYLPLHNQQFTVEPQEKETAYISWVSGDLKEILCHQEERCVQNDNTVSYQGRRLQIGKNSLRHHYVKVTVQVREYSDGSLGIFHGPRCIGRYCKQGHPLDDDQLAA